MKIYKCLKIMIVFICLFLQITVQGQFIINGEDITIEDAPWTVSIGNMNNNFQYIHSCGGTIISDEVIVTAAHCVSGGNITHIHAGATDSEDMGSGQIIEVASIVIHPDYDASDLSNDIAVISLEHPLCLDDVTVQAISYSTSGNYVGQDAFITGWGYDINGSSVNQLAGAVLPIIPNSDADDFYPNSTTPCGVSRNIDQDFYLSLHDYNGTAAGFQDSGGPAIIQVNGAPLLVGVTSFGCHPREMNPSIFSNVSFLSDFIDDNMVDNFDEPTVLSGTISGTYNEGPYIISGDVILEANKGTALSGLFIMEFNSSITVPDLAEAHFYWARFTSCANIWKGITLSEGATGSFTSVRISDADVAIEVNSDLFSFSDLAIDNCQTGLLVDFENEGTAIDRDLELEFAKFVHSPVECHNTSIRFNGCKFYDSDLDFHNCEVMVAESHTVENTSSQDDDTPGFATRSVFLKSKIKYHSGPEFWSEFAYYDKNSSIDVEENCDFVNITWNKFEDHNNSSINLNAVKKHDVHGNIFSSPRVALQVTDPQSTMNDPSHFQNNVCLDQKYSVKAINEMYFEFQCNHHDDIDEISYQIHGNVSDQGNPNKPANNYFTNSTLDLEVNEDFLYYYDQQLLATIPSYSGLNGNPAPSGFELIIINPFGVNSDCYERGFIENVWDVELCEPWTWLLGVCYETCTLCGDCETLLSNGIAGKQVNTNPYHSFQSADTGKAASDTPPLEVVAERLSFSTASYNRTLVIVNALGQVIATEKITANTASYNLNILTSGMYIALVIDEQNAQVLTQKYILIP